MTRTIKNHVTAHQERKILATNGFKPKILPKTNKPFGWNCKNKTQRSENAAKAIHDVNVAKQHKTG